MFLGGGKEKSEYHPVVAWDRLAEIAGRYLGKGQQVAIEGPLQTRSWDDEKGARHWIGSEILWQIGNPGGVSGGGPHALRAEVQRGKESTSAAIHAAAAVVTFLAAGES